MIHIIITTSIYDKVYGRNDNHRQNTYVESIQHLLNLIKNMEDIKPIIVENNGLRETYLNDFNCDVCYTYNNIVDFENKGGNELLDIKEIIKRYNILEDDFIIKITGRYKLLNLNFINLVKQNIQKYEAFVKFFNVCTEEYTFYDCIMGLYCIKCKYIQSFNYNFIKSPECEFAEYIRNNIDPHKIMEITQLDLECCFADDLRILIV